MYGVGPFIEQFILNLLAHGILQIPDKVCAKLPKHVPNVFIGIFKFNMYLLSVIFFETVSVL